MAAFRRGSFEPVEPVVIVRFAAESGSKFRTLPATPRAMAVDGAAQDDSSSEPARNLIERLFNKIKQGRCVATGYDKLAADYLAFIKLHQSEFGYALMSPRPSTTLAEFGD